MKRRVSDPWVCEGSRARFQRFWRALLLLGLPVGLASPRAGAQAFDGDFSVQRFTAAPGPHNFLTTRGVRMDGKMTYSVGFLANYAYRPFMIRSCATESNCNDPGLLGTDRPVIENMVTGDVLGSLTPVPRVQIGLRVPVTWVKGQGTPDFENRASGVNAVGIGDAELEGKFRWLGAAEDPFVAGAAVFVTGPLGHLTSKGHYVGDTNPSAGLRMIFDGVYRRFSLGGNLTGIYRGNGRAGTTRIGPEFRYGVGAGYRITPVVRVVVDTFGSTRFTASRGENTLEALGGLHVVPLNSTWMVSVGAGSGVIEGVGVPSVRAFAGILFVDETRDRDQDGISESLDRCPSDKEDLDGYEDADGCADPDNDSDGILDGDDKCPNQLEDQDGFQDQDGCPDPDNDQDGVEDAQDRCPSEPETKNGFKDEDGCPDEPDRDNDGISDAKDRCPTEVEDTDGFEDTDGCPDLDNDKDGIPDDQDECVNEPETINRFEDGDGCPDVANLKKKKGR